MDDLSFPEHSIDEVLAQWDDTLPLGLESVAVATMLSDIALAVVIRTARNIANTISGQTTYPLVEFKDRHRLILPKLLNNRQLNITTNVLPCPPGMQTTYLESCKILQDIATKADFATLAQTLSTLRIATLKSDRIALVELDQSITKQDNPSTLMDELKANFKTGGLAYRQAKDLFTSVTDVGMVYNQILGFHSTMKTFEKVATVIAKVSTTKPKTDLDKDVYALVNKIVRRIAETCRLAYHVLEKMMQIEHNYVRCLDSFYRQMKTQ